MGIVWALKNMEILELLKHFKQSFLIITKNTQLIIINIL